MGTQFAPYHLSRGVTIDRLPAVRLRALQSQRLLPQVLRLRWRLRLRSAGLCRAAAGRILHVREDRFRRIGHRNPRVASRPGEFALVLGGDGSISALCRRRCPLLGDPHAPLRDLPTSGARWLTIRTRNRR